MYADDVHIQTQILQLSFSTEEQTSLNICHKYILQFTAYIRRVTD